MYVYKIVILFILSGITRNTFGEDACARAATGKDVGRCRKKSKMAYKLRRVDDIEAATLKRQEEIQKLGKELYKKHWNDKLNNNILGLYSTASRLCKTPPSRSPNCQEFNATLYQKSPSLLNLYTNGRLGNQMSTLATLYAYADQLRLIPILYQDQVDALTTFFPNVRGFADTLEEAYCDPCDLPWEGFADFLRKPLKTKASYERGRAFAMISYHQNPTAYKHYLPTFRKMLFKLDNDYVNRGLIALASAAGDIPIVNNPKLVLIGVHVRRTDYAASTANHGGTLAPARYYEKAMDHFRKRYGWGGRRKMMFVVVSDDMAWCRANLGGADDVYLLGSHEEGVSEVEQTENLGFDLGLMLNCHHVIVSHGTLGMWLGMLVGGDTVMADDTAMKEPLEEVQMIRAAKLEKWTFMDYN